MDQQAEQVALITGAGSGLGKAVALELAPRGWSMFLQHADGNPVDAVAAEIASAAEVAGCDTEAQFAPADITTSTGREELVDAALDAFGRIDLLVNAASLTSGPADDLLEVTEEAYQHIMNAGVTSTLFLTQLVANEMVRLAETGAIENPRIVTINSIGAYTTSMDRGPQCIARAAGAMVTKLFADRLGEHGISTYEVRCGIITSGSADASHARYDELIASGLTPIRRWGRPGDVALAVAAIADGLLGFSTGEVINVDGGFHLRRL